MARRKITGTGYHFDPRSGIHWASVYVGFAILRRSCGFTSEDAARAHLAQFTIGDWIL